MALDLTQKTENPAPFTGTRIISGGKLPKNWKENLLKQKDEKYQKLWKAWDQETNPELEKQRHQELQEYWAKRRLELGIEEE